MDDRPTLSYIYDCPLTEQTYPITFLIGAALDYGAAKSGCAEGPDTLRRLRPELLMTHAGIQTYWDKTLHAFQKLDQASTQSEPDNTLSIIHDFSLELAKHVKETVCNGQHFIVIGGDHACAIGTWTGAAMAVADQGPMGLIWIDAHLDAHTLESSPSGRVHGMPVASLLGHGSPLLTDLLQPGAKLLPQHVCLVGIRSYEQAELDLLNKLGVRVIFMEEVNRYGLDAAFKKAIDIASNGTAGFGISLDLDAIHPNDAPAVGSPVPGGIRASQLLNAMTKLNKHKKLLGYEIAEFNPSLDINNKTAKLICDLLVATATHYSFDDGT